jgi:hypothetical protein
MDFFRGFSDKTNTYTQKIKSSSFLEGEVSLIKEETKPHYSSLLELMLKVNDIEYNALERNQLQPYVKQTMISLASDVTLGNIDSKILSKEMIEKGLVCDNYLSSILYLNELWKVNCIIENKETGVLYRTGFKPYTPVVCQYHKGKWYESSQTVNEKTKYGEFSDLHTIFTMDVTTNEIYVSPLKHIQSYKVKDLEAMAVELNLSLQTPDGKKKRKQALYDEIKIVKLKQDI